MNILFIHQNMPGQFKHLAARLAADPANRVAFITKQQTAEIPGVRKFVYTPARDAHPSTHHYLRSTENAVLHGQEVSRILLQLQRGGFRPDIVIAHPGWGEVLFAKDIFPTVPLLNYCEFYYHGVGADLGFDRDAPADVDAICRARARNAPLLLSLEACDHGISPTHWQKTRHPAAFRDKISVIFDGIDSAIARPEPAARFDLPNGRVLTAADEVVTYVARNLEPYRGFKTFMRALPELCRRRPEAEIVIVGGDEVSYGRPAPGGKTWRETLCAEVPVDPARVHFLGWIDYERYLSLLQVSSAHVYLTVPFVLSWSVMEALATGCVIVGSATSPVEEIIEDGRNGFLVDYFSPAGLAERVADVLQRRAALGEIRRAARDTVLERYELQTCLAAQIGLIRGIAGGT
jgi:glycosyltransferase involved in cell wall biosynthesis